MVATKREECEYLSHKFYSKFSVYPLIQYRRDQSGTWMFMLIKDEMITGAKHYKIGETFPFAQWYVNNLKQIPTATKTFETLAEVQAYKKEQKEKKKKVDNNDFIRNPK